MKDKDKAEEQLLNELVEMRQRIAELEAEETERRRAEEALRESEERFRTIVETAPSLLLITDAKGNNIYVSPNCEGITGYTQEELQGQVVWWVHEDDTPRAKEVYDRTFREGVGCKGLEYKAVKKNGELWYASSSWEPFKDAKGKLEGVVFQTTDITKRKRAEEALRESEEQFRAIFERAAIGISLADREGRYIESNPALQKMLGYDEEELRGMAFAEITHPDDAEMDMALHRALMAGKRDHFQIEKRYMRKDGRLVWGRLTVSLIRGVGGEPQYDIGMVEDITERKRAEAALQRRAAQLELLNDIGGRLAATLELDSVLDLAARLVQERFGYYHVALFDIDHEWGELVMRARAGAFTDLFPSEHRLKLGQGMVGWVGRHGQSLLANDVDAEPRYVNLYPDLVPTQSELSVPIQVGGEVVGVLDVQSPQLNAFDLNDVMVMETLASQVAVAIENARLYEAVQRELTERKRAEEALQQHTAQLEALREVGLELTAQLDLDALFRSIVSRAIELLEGAEGSLHLYHPERDVLESRMSIGSHLAPTGSVLRRGEGLAGKIWETGEPLIVDDYQHWEGRVSAYEGYPFTAIVGVPVRWGATGAGEEFLGVLNVNADPTRTFSPADAELLSLFATQAAIAIQNAQLYERAQQDARTKATLLQEVNHRVKNNLTAIIGLLYAERRRGGMEDQPAYQSLLDDLTNRVQGLARVHDMLSATEWAPLPLDQLTRQIIHAALQMLPRDRRISVDVPPSPVRVTPKQANSLALVINELTTNTVKYALLERPKAYIGVRVALEEDDTILLEFRDDGPGYPEEVLRLERPRVGLYLIQTMVRDDLRGELALRNDRGAVTTIRFKKDPLGFGNPKGLDEDDHAKRYSSIDR